MIFPALDSDWKKKQEYWAAGISLLFLLVLVLISVVNSTTGDNGDSIVHFLYSKYSWYHPEYWFHRWAKPVFTFLSSPFSQFGMVGMKVYNSIVVAATVWLSCLICIRWNFRYWYLVPFLIVFSAFYGVHIFSGLTEFTYGLFLILSIYLVQRDKLLAATVLISFLPFVRNEGVLGMLLMAIYLGFRKEWKYLPLLAIGYIVTDLLGVIIAGFPLFWTITQGAYDAGGTPYGKGDFWVFIKVLRFVIEWPFVILLLTGIASMAIVIRKFFQGQKEFQILLLLIYGNFLGFYLGHAILHELGRFGSMGLPRVLHSVVPLAAIIAVYGLQYVARPIERYFRYVVPFIAVVVVLYPFIRRPAAMLWSPNVLNIPENIKVDEEVMPYLEENDLMDFPLYYNYPYLSITTETNGLKLVGDAIFVKAHHLAALPQDAVYVWDHWYSVQEGGVNKESLQQANFVEQKCFVDQYWKWTYEFCVFQKSPAR